MLIPKREFSPSWFRSAVLNYALPPAKIGNWKLDTTRRKGGYQSRNISISIDPFTEVIIPFFAALRRKKRRRQVFRCPSYLSSLWNKDTAGAEWFPWLISTFLSFGFFFLEIPKVESKYILIFASSIMSSFRSVWKKNCFHSNNSVLYLTSLNLFGKYSWLIDIYL